MRKQLVMAFVLVIAAKPAWAQPSLSEVDLRPLLRIHQSQAFLEGNPQGPPIQFFNEADRLITRGGGLINLETTSVNGGPPTQLIARGVALPEELARLRLALVVSAVGQLADCEIGSDLSSGTTEVTWYGRGSRRHQVRAVYAVPGASGLPPCSSGFVALLEEILVFTNSVQAHPASEVLISDLP